LVSQVTGATARSEGLGVQLMHCMKLHGVPTARSQWACQMGSGKRRDRPGTPASTAIPAHPCSSLAAADFETLSTVCPHQPTLEMPSRGPICGRCSPKRAPSTGRQSIKTAPSFLLSANQATPGSTDGSDRLLDQLSATVKPCGCLLVPQPASGEVAGAFHQHQLFTNTDSSRKPHRKDKV